MNNLYIELMTLHRAPLEFAHGMPTLLLKLTVYNYANRRCIHGTSHTSSVELYLC